MGGVIIPISQPRAIERFKELGLKDAVQCLNPYKQKGIFGELEGGNISAEEFRQELSNMLGREVTMEECSYGWLGYLLDVPRKNFDTLLKLRSEGYRIILVSNNNPFVTDYIMSPGFDGCGHGLGYYLDAVYVSYRLKCMKPSEEFFRKVFAAENTVPEECLFVDDSEANISAGASLGMHTFLAENGADWTQGVINYLKSI